MVLPAASTAATTPTTAGVSAITVTYGDSDSEEEDAAYTRDIGPSEVEVNAGEVRLKADNKWKTPKAILKRKAETEKDLPRPKTLQAGKWENTRVAEPTEAIVLDPELEDQALHVLPVKHDKTLKRGVSRRRLR